MNDAKSLRLADLRARLSRLNADLLVCDDRAMSAMLELDQQEHDAWRVCEAELFTIGAQLADRIETLEAQP